jgi:hypothetical protein
VDCRLLKKISRYKKKEKTEREDNNALWFTWISWELMTFRQRYDIIPNRNRFSRESGNVWKSIDTFLFTNYIFTKKKSQNFEEWKKINQILSRNDAKCVGFVNIPIFTIKRHECDVVIVLLMCFVMDTLPVTWFVKKNEN